MTVTPKKCQFIGIVHQFLHKRKHQNKDKFYCPQCIVDFREAGKRRVGKSRLGKKNKGSLRESNPIDTTADIRTLVAVAGPSAPTQAAVAEPSAVYNISGVIKRTPFIGKMTVGIGSFPLFYEDIHALSVFTSRMSYQVLQVGQKLIAGSG